MSFISLCFKRFSLSLLEVFTEFMYLPSFNEPICDELFNELVNQSKLGELKSPQEFSKKEEWFIKNWMTEKPIN